MKIRRVPLLAIVLLASACATHSAHGPRSMAGHFSYLDASSPGCGIFAWASKATFVVEGTGESVKLAVPCVAMQLVDHGSGQETPIRTGERYEIVLDWEPPVPDMQSPYLFRKHPWYLSRVTK